MHDVVEVFEVMACNRFCAVGDLHLVITPAPEDEILGPIEELQPGVSVLGDLDVKTGIYRHLCRRMTAHLTGLHVGESRIDKLVGGVKLSIFEVDPSAAQPRIDLQLLLWVQVLLEVNDQTERSARIAE